MILNGYDEAMLHLLLTVLTDDAGELEEFNSQLADWMQDCKVRLEASAFDDV
jgi:hypothetical protein